MTGSSQAVAPVATGTLARGLTDLSQAHTSTHLAAHSRITKLVPRQQASASESVSFADSVPGPGGGVGALDELEFANWVDE